jgi:serine phosphatase RsbU (regulator of sigma subunit)
MCIAGACQGIEPESLAVGLFDDAVFENRRQELDGFERLSVVSDGFLELLDDVSLQEKELRLLELGADPTHTMEDVLKQMTNQGKTRFASDDITVLIIERVK